MSKQQPRKLARAAIIYSEDNTSSLESRNLAFYFCGLLSKGGYANIVLVPYSKDGPSSILPSVRISYFEAGSSKPREVPVSTLIWNDF